MRCCAPSDVRPKRQSRSRNNPPSCAVLRAAIAPSFSALAETPISRARTSLRRLNTISALVLAACGAPTDADGPRVVSAELSAPAPLVRTLRVELDRPAEVTEMVVCRELQNSQKTSPPNMHA